MSNLTYVTAYINIYDNAVPLQRTNEWRLQHFRNIACSKIQICIIVSPDCEPAISDLVKEFPNIHILKTMTIQDTWVYRHCLEFEDEYTLPEKRSLTKDTEAYIQLQNSKTEFLQIAINENPFHSTHFAWIDFSIAHMFRNLTRSQRQLQILGKAHLEQTFFAMPGCWGKWDPARHDHHMENIHWRFCGCFFIADKDSMLEFCNLYRELFPRFLKETKKLLWEVNIWPWMEYVSEWKPTWYDADHNDRCIQVPNDFFMNPLIIKKTIQYDYPTIEHFQPGSTCYIKFQDQHIINTRYVSYYLTPQGYYLYPDGSQTIKNKNLCSILNEQSLEPLSYKPLVEMLPAEVSHHWFIEMNENLEQVYIGSPSIGLEDMRLYEVDGKLRFISTTMGYSPVGKSRMMIGNYDLGRHTYSDCQIVFPPNPDSWCEKNWTPVVQEEPMIFSSCSVPSFSEIFIYKWSPMEIGKLVKSENGELNLEIIESYDIQEPWFHKLRGSTVFSKVDGKLLGVTHFSEEGSPRRYYHMLIELDPVNLRPLRYSIPFYFLNKGVEFCIGFTVIKDDYVFWISQNDRDPLTVIVEKNDILLSNTVND
jgi:hypothetical protein